MNKEKIWLVLQEWHNQNGEFPEVWRGYNTLSDETETPISELKKFIAYLRSNRIMYHAPIVSNEYEPTDSGYFIYSSFVDYSWQEIEAEITRRIEE